MIDQLSWDQLYLFLFDENSYESLKVYEESSGSQVPMKFPQLIELMIPQPQIDNS